LTMAAQGNGSRILRRVEGERLVFYWSAADRAFWDEHWRDEATAGLYTGARKGALGFYTDIFPRYLPRQGRVIEAGCGLGNLVLALRARGYDCEGVEWAPETVERVRSMAPDLPIRVGDVLKLDVPDKYYHAYVSLGVVEHRPEGPEPFLVEAARVLADDGVMLLSVPHFHGLRRLKARLGWFRRPPEGREFYAQAMTRADMTEVLRRCGFRVDAVVGVDPWKGLKDEIPLVLRLFRVPGIGRKLDAWWRRCAWAQRRLGHMILFVCRKDGSPTCVTGSR